MAFRFRRNDEGGRGRDAVGVAVFAWWRVWRWGGSGFLGLFGLWGSFGFWWGASRLFGFPGGTLRYPFRLGLLVGCLARLAASLGRRVRTLLAWEVLLRPLDLHGFGRLLSGTNA